MQLVVRPAAADLEHAFLWYEQQRTGLGHEFLAAAKVAFEKILSNPAGYPVVHRSTQRALVRRFPYGVYFRVYPEAIVVVACMHGRRDPQAVEITNLTANPTIEWTGRQRCLRQPSRLRRSAAAHRDRLTAGEVQRWC